MGNAAADVAVFALFARGCATDVKLVDFDIAEVDASACDDTSRLRLFKCGCAVVALVS